MACPQGVRTVHLGATVSPISITSHFLNTISAVSVYLPIYSRPNFHIDLH